MKKRFFIEILKEICAEDNLKLEIFSHEWLCKVTGHDGKCTWTEGYNFSLNTSVNYIVLYDKVSTSIVLKSNNVPSVEHFLIIQESWRKGLLIQKSWEEELEEIHKEIGDNVVVKYANGSQGLDIYRCESRSEAKNVVSLLKNKQNLAISKYYKSEFEYRFYILDSEVLFAYKKIKQSGWKHNLSQGAKAELVDESFSKYKELKELALKGYDAMQMRCGAIDILDTEEGLKIIEINNGIMMDGFSATSPVYYKIAKEAHRKMLYKCLE